MKVKQIARNVAAGFLGLMFFIFSSAALHASCHAVSPTGSGTKSGADWNNAMAGWPSSPIRGDVYYLAAGTFPQKSYGAVSPSKGGANITFMKARDTGDHGQNCSPSIAAGWTSAMGAQTVIGGMFEVFDDNWTLDGQDNGGQAIDSGSSYGIYINGTNCSGGSGQSCYNVSINQGSNITVRYVYIQGSSPSANNSSCNSNQSCNTDDNIRFVSWGGSGSSCDNITIQHVFVYNSSHNDITSGGCANVLIENSEFYINAAGSYFHGQSFNIVDGGNDNWIVRNNVFRDITGTAVIVNLASSGGTNTGIDIYGNVFFADSSWSPVGAPCENGIYACINNITCNDLHFYNNSIINYQNGAFACGVNYLNTAGVQSGHSAIVENNLWYGTPTSGIGLQGSGTKTQDHNSFLNSGSGNSGTANVINQSASCPLGNCSIWSGVTQFIPLVDNTTINNGVALSAPYNLDPAGVTRNASDWTRGAFQFPGSSVVVNPPTNLQLVVK